MFYDNLLFALDDVARRTFHEGCLVTPYKNPQGEVAAWSVINSPTDWEVYWSNDDGLDIRGYHTDCTRLMEPAEYFDSWRRIQYHFPEVVAFLEEGVGYVWFSYEDVMPVDPLVDDDFQHGWVLVCRTYTPSEGALTVVL